MLKFSQIIPTLRCVSAGADLVPDYDPGVESAPSSGAGLSRDRTEGSGECVSFRYSPLLRRTLPGFVAIAWGIGAFFLFLMAWAGSAGAGAVALFFLSHAWFGSRLLPYLGASITIEADGLRLAFPSRGEVFHPWESLSRVVDHKIFQVVDLYDSHGKCILSLDYLLKGSSILRVRLKESLRR